MVKIFSAVIAVFLLAIYSVVIVDGLIDFMKIELTTEEEAISAASKIISIQTASTFTLIGGLVAALVTSVLAITPPNDTMEAGQRVMGFEKGSPKNTIANKIIFAYVAVWVILGAATLLIGYMGWFTPFKNIQGVRNAVLAEHGKAWLGLAIGAAYAFFKLNKGDEPHEDQ